MITFTEALAAITQAAEQNKLTTERVELDFISGRICAEKILAPRSLQPFTNSAMDGYAFNHQDSRRSGDDQPLLKVSTTIPAGAQPPSIPLAPGECARILTGAPVPPGADSIIPVENTEQPTTGYVSFNQTPNHGANIRRAGEDIIAGHTLIEPGTWLDTGHTMPLAALGIPSLAVFRKPRVAIITTGNEITRELNSHLHEGQIFDSNHYYIQAFLQHFNSEIISSTHLKDDHPGFCQHLRQLMANQPDLIISSGAVSAGAEHDYIRSGLEQIGAEILFHKVAIRPGKPNLLARLPNGTLYFGLPGNPLATAAGLRFLVSAALRAITHQPMEQALIGRCRSAHKKKKGFCQALLSTCEFDSDHRLLVNIPESQPSFMTSPLLSSNCWTLLPADSENIGAGTQVEIYPLVPEPRSWSRLD